MGSHDDIPFLVDSARMAINRYGYQVHFIIHFGGLKLKRDSRHHVTEIISFNAVENETLSEAPIYIDDSSDTTALVLKAKCRRLARDPNSHLGLIIVDYLQLMRAATSGQCWYWSQHATNSSLLTQVTGIFG